MRYLNRSSAVMSLMWMTAIDQYLGPVACAGGWRVRWIRIDPMTDAGIQISVHEDPLACPTDRLDLREHPALDPTPIDFTTTIRHAGDVPPDCAPGANAECAALLWAERGADAKPNRWVNPAVDGWRYLGELRGHE